MAKPTIEGDPNVAVSPAPRAGRNRIVHNYDVYAQVTSDEEGMTGTWRELTNVKAMGITAERALDQAFAAGLEIGPTYRVVESAKSETFQTKAETRPVITRA